ncbi:MAG: PIN domain-containing protein [Jiangellaceae bacterium]
MIVIDTSGVLAAKDAAHPQHRAVAEAILGTSHPLLLSPFVVAECDYMLATRLGVDAAREFIDEIARDAFQLVEVDSGDVAAAGGIIDRYGDLNIGITDASLVIVAARYQTTRLLTFDERHFRTVAPLWGAPAFTLLPADRPDGRS